MRWQHLGIVLASALLAACTGELVVDQSGGGGGGDVDGGDVTTPDGGGGGGSMARQFFDDNVAGFLGGGNCDLCHADPPLGDAPEFLGDSSPDQMYNRVLNSQYVDLANPAASTFLVDDGHDGGAAPGLDQGQKDAVIEWLELEAM